MGMTEKMQKIMVEVPLGTLPGNDPDDGYMIMMIAPKSWGASEVTAFRDGFKAGYERRVSDEGSIHATDISR